MKSKLLLASICSALLVSLVSLVAADTLVAQSPIELTGTQGKFDFIKIDAARHRLLACHTGNGSLDVIDTTTSKLIKSVPTGAAQGVAIDAKNGRYFVSASKPPKLVIVDTVTLEVTGEVPLPAPADLVAYHAESNRVEVCNDEKPELWTIDPEAKKILTTLTLTGGGMEDLDFNADGKVLFQCLKDTSKVAVIDLKAGKVSAQWATAPADGPHGLAMVPGTGTFLVVGGNGKLVLMDSATGHILASADVSPRIDELAYDPGWQRAYGASGLGVISVVAVESGKLTALAPLTSSAGAHSLAVDPQTHAVWIAYAKEGKAYVQGFTVK